MPKLYYHDFSRLGFHNRQLPGIFAPNQEAKMPVICAYIMLAIAKLRCEGEREISFAELFCADAFYSIFARKWGADTAVGIDNDRDGYPRLASVARKRAGVPDVQLVRGDVMELPTNIKYSIVANVGGLYHVEDPVRVLRHSWELSSGFLIVQSAVSMANDDPAYFETPAPGWDWGSRFNRRSFQRMVEREGYNVIDSAFNELTGNERLEDRGSVYYLIRKAP